MDRGLLAVAFATTTLLAAGPGFAKPSPKPPAKPAAAGPRDKAVLKIDQEALGKDYLETNFIRAEKRLQQAIALCGKAACSPGVRAQLYRDLAVVQLAGLGKVDAAKVDLKMALDLDPDLALDPDLTTPELNKAFEQVRGVKPKPEASKPVKKGIVHTPVVEQAVATPVPIFAGYTGSATKLRIRYKPVGGDRWASADMTPSGEGFAGEIPCAAAAKEGDLQYFIEALGDDGENLETDGSRSEPHAITIKKALEGEAPHLPDAPPPDRCKDVCVGDDCAGNGGGGGAKHPRNNWFVLSVQQDLAIVGAGTSVCNETNQTTGSYSCFRAAGSQYHGIPLDDAGDNVNGGLAPATTRIRIGFDRVIVAGLVIGVRLGYALRGLGPRADGGHAPLPFDAEGRLAYWFREDVFSNPGVRPFIFAAGGVAQVDSRFNVTVHEDTSQPPPPSQTDNPASQQLAAYRRMGQGWAGGGAGLMYAFTPWAGIVLDVKYMRMFPTAGNVISPELGVAFGF